MSPLLGDSGVILQAVVVGDYQGAEGLKGFFLQERDADVDGDPATSEGIFVFSNEYSVDINVGDVVRVQGTVAEFKGLTELTAVTRMAVCSTNEPLPSSSTISLPVATSRSFENVEGMRVSFSQTLHVTGNYNLARYGEVELSVGGPLDNPTSVVAPGTSANALQDLNDRSRIQLDDGSRLKNPSPLPPYLGDDGTLRIGDTVTGLLGVMGQFNAYEVHPTSPLVFTRINARPDVPASGGAIRLASFNLSNYFTTLDNNASICGPRNNLGCRGAHNKFEFSRQRQKLLAAIARLDADVAGLVELENDADSTAIAELVFGLNEFNTAGTYAFIDTGVIGSDAIRVGFIYRPSVVTPLGRAILDRSFPATPAFDDDKNRPTLAQTFSVNDSGEVFTLVLNHLKSKGSPCSLVDVGDGQGNCNQARVNAVKAMLQWLAGDPTASGSDKILILGDLNAYAMEDPISMLKASAYVDIVERHVGSGFNDGAHSFSFAGQAGRLDHALASPALAGSVTGVVIWHINADEPRGLDYNDFNQPGLYHADEFRSSDHDPVVIDLFGKRDSDDLPVAVDN